MNHYICTGGCDGLSKEPGQCQAIACPKFGMALDECECADGKHAAKPAVASAPESKKPDHS